MHIINTLIDIDKNLSNKDITEDFAKYLKDYFKSLYENIKTGENIE